MSAAAHSPPPVESFVEVLPVPPLQERRRGVVRFIGLTDFAEGEWVGVELVGSEGRNDGAVKGQSYFRCLPGQGVFVRPNLVVPYGSSHKEEVEAVSPQPPPPDPALTARIAALEEQLASAQQQTAKEEEEKAVLWAEVQRAREDAAAATAAAAAKRAADEDDELAAQVRQEEDRLALQRQLQACQAELHSAQEAAKAAVGRQTAAEANVKSLQDELKVAHTALTKTQAEHAAAAAAAAAAPPSTSSLPRVDAATAAEVERLRSALQRSEAALLELRAEKDSSAAAAATEMTEKLQAQQALLDAAEMRASEAERRLREAQQHHSAAAAEASTAQDTAVAQLRAQIEAQKAESAKLDELRAVEIRALEERLSSEHAAALRAHEAASQAALTAAQREREELHELCQLLEDELKEEKSQSDELARLVEQLGAEKAAAESTVGSAQVQTVQERDRLRREVEDGRVREVQLKTALERAQTELDAVLNQQHQQQQQQQVAASPASTAEPHESSAAALEKCRNALDDAELRLLQLSSTEQVAQALQQRCDELDHTLQTQRQEAQQRLAALQASAAAAHAKAAEEVLLWKRQCVAAQRQVVDLGTTVEQLQQQVAHGGGPTQRSAPPAAASPLDAMREKHYEEKIATLTRQLLAFHDVRLSAVAAAMSRNSAPCGAATADGGPMGLARPSVRVLDFSTPEACTASTQSLFR